MKKKVLTAIISCAAVCMFSAEMQNITLQIAVPAKSKITIDGKLDEKAWASAPVHGKYYVYMNVLGKTALTKTHCRLMYDADGIYLGIENFCDPKLIRNVITTNNHVDIWTDDCAEIYFNPLADRVSFIRYAVNSNGASHSMSRDTTLLTNGNYMAPGSKFKCYTGDESWNIEGFFPWEDLQLSTGAKNGDVWQFAHIRYAWPNNQFIGSSSAVNAAYSRPHNFGYLLFTDGRQPDLQQIGAILNKKIPGSWGMGVDDKLLSGDGSQFRIALIAEEFRKSEQLCKSQFADIRGKKISASSKKILDGIALEWKKLDGLKKSNPVAWLVGTMRVMEKLRDLQWRVKLEEKYQ